MLAQLAADPIWAKLMRYRSTVWTESGVESEVDDPLYFIHPQGKERPNLELKATWEGLWEKASADPNTHVQCRFPARKKWLIQKLQGKADLPPSMTCPEYEMFRDKFQSQKISVVFSAYFLGNPGSSFGHSLMKFSLKSNRSESELLDYGLNSGAIPTTDNPLLYAVFGIIGLFKGNYSFFPYYYKIREYNDYESRDLWSYELNLSEEERAFLVDHVWEIGKSYYDYYFFFENCSYQMLTLLDFKFPQDSPVDALHFYVIPTDTLRALVKVPGLVSNVSFRPASKTAFLEAYRFMREQGPWPLLAPWFERLIVKENVGDLKRLNSLSLEQQALLLDTVVSYIDFKHAHDLLDKEPKISAWRRQILLARSELGLPSTPLPYTEQKKHAPHLGHRSSRLSLWSGISPINGAVFMPEMKFAFHDLLDSTLGHPREAQVDFMRIRGRYNQKSGAGRKRAKLEEVSILEVSSLSPWNSQAPLPSWQVKLGQRLLRNRNCRDCQGYLLDGGYGISAALAPAERLSVSVLGSSSLGATEKIQGQRYHLGIGPKLVARLHLSDQFKVMLSGLYHYEVGMRYPHFFDQTLEARYSINDSWAISLESHWRPADWEALLGVNFYLGP